MPDSFSQRHGYSGPAKEISIREDAPESLRVTVLETARTLNYGPHDLRSALCTVLRKRPDPYNWSEYPNVWDEAQNLMYGCDWFKVYDVIETIAREIKSRDPQGTFEKSINQCFLEEGIGWQLVKGRIVTRGDEGFQEAVKTAASQLSENQRPTAASHIQSAVKALSERPKANTPGAVSHATSAVECVLHDVTGEEMTLGKYLDKYPKLFHPALKKALDGVYGYASDAGARHGKEGKEPSFDEAQFAVTTCAATCTRF
jgi:AbiJ-like protein